MRIAMIGGVERNETDYARIAERAGHSLEFHGGWIGGRGADTLAALIARAELVIIVTDVNSHGAVILARRLAAERGRPIQLLRRMGTSRFRSLLEALTKPARESRQRVREVA